MPVEFSQLYPESPKPWSSVKIVMMFGAFEPVHISSGTWLAEDTGVANAVAVIATVEKVFTHMFGCVIVSYETCSPWKKNKN